MGSNNFNIGTIHLRHWQNSQIFDPYPPTVGSFLVLSVGKFGKFLTPPPQEHADVLNGWSLIEWVLAGVNYWNHKKEDTFSKFTTRRDLIKTLPMCTATHTMPDSIRLSGNCQFSFRRILGWWVKNTNQRKLLIYYTKGKTKVARLSLHTFHF